MYNSYKNIAISNEISEFFLQYIFGVENEGILLLSEDKIMFANKFFLQQTGYNGDSLLQIPIENIIPPYARKIAFDIIHEKTAKNQIQYIPILKKNYQETNFLSKIQCIQQNGKSIKILHLSLPAIDNYINAEIDLDLYKCILKSVSENIMVINKEFQILTLIRIKSNKFDGVGNLSQIFSSPAIKRLGEIFNRKWYDGESRLFELQNYRTSLECRLLNYKDNLYVFSFNEITLRKRIEDKLIDSQIQLDRLNKEKDLLLSIIAHDLKNPFNIINGFCSVLLNSGKKFPEAKKEEIIQLIYTASGSGHSLLENLLEWSRSQANRILFEPQKIQLRELTNHIASFYAFNIDAKNIHLSNTITENHYVMADKNMLSTILRNLISNAIKFTANNGNVDISSDLYANDFVKISIKDNGVGMTDTQLKDLFQVGKNKSTKGTQGERGTGLGLLLCKEFIEKHNGELSASSIKNEGSDFSFTLPVYSN